jgi:hypothetical protein
MRVLAIALLLAAIVLAGCTGGSAGDDTPEGLPDVKPTEEGKGAIGGVVVDEAIRPIPGAVVSLTSLSLNVTTGDEGTFSWSDLEPGTYFISVRAPRFISVQSSAEVVAGETSFVRVQLAADTSPLPYQETYQKTGFMQAWGGIGQFVIENQQDNGSALCDCRLYFTPVGSLSAAIYEAFWEWTVPDPANQAELYYVVEQLEGDADESGYCYSPCNVHIGGDSFTPNVQAYARLDGPDLWVAYNQQFELFVTLFYNGDAPSGWTIAGA